MNPDITMDSRSSMGRSHQQVLPGEITACGYLHDFSWWPRPRTSTCMDFSVNSGQGYQLRCCRTTGIHGNLWLQHGLEQRTIHPNKASKGSMDQRLLRRPRSAYTSCQLLRTRTVVLLGNMFRADLECKLQATVHSLSDMLLCSYCLASQK